MKESIAHYAVLAGLLAMALFNGVAATANLVTAFDPDLYRDIGHAYNIHAGHWFADPQLAGEALWYNPLAPALVALVAQLSGLDPAVSYLRVGAWVGILAPLTFYLFLRNMANRDIALLATVSFVLLSGADPAIPYPATYSPWLHSWNLAQVFFYLAMISLHRVTLQSSTRWIILTGVVWGITFLGHFYPAILLGGISLVLVALGRLSLRNLLVMMAIAFLTSLPFSFSILFNYAMQVKNSIVVEWIYADVRELAPYLLLYLGWQVPLWLLGLWALCRKRGSTGFLILQIWVAAVFTSLLYTSLWDNALNAGLRLPPLTFSIHTSFYFSAVLSMLFATGAVFAIGKLPWPQVSRYAPVAAATLILVASLPVYPKRAAFTEWPEFAQYNQAFFEETGFSSWVRENTRTDTVILARPTQSLSMVIASGRKVVAGPALWSNPYVDVDARSTDQASMFAALEAGRWDDFFGLSRKYDVEYLLLLDQALAQKLPEDNFQPVVQHPQLSIFALRSLR